MYYQGDPTTFLINFCTASAGYREVAWSNSNKSEENKCVFKPCPLVIKTQSVQIRTTASYILLG